MARLEHRHGQPSHPRRRSAKVEGRNFDIRKQLLGIRCRCLRTRKVIYGQRQLSLRQGCVLKTIHGHSRDVVADAHQSIQYPPQKPAEQWGCAGLEQHLMPSGTCKAPVQECGWMPTTRCMKKGCVTRILDELIKA